MSYVDSAFKSPLTSISIGPGIRGIERGVERVVRLEHLAYVEIEAFIVENLVAQMELGVLAPAVIWSDAKTLPCEPFRGLVDILFAGYPCQPFSTAGKRRGTEDPRHLFPYIERAIRIIRPRTCFFENVRGHVTCGLPDVISALEGLGYRVHWGIYSAEETGAAHKRERVFILAVANSESTGIRRRLRDVHQADGRSDGELPFIADGTGSELANHNCLNGWRQQQLEGGNGAGSRDKSTGCGELANTNSNESERDGRSGRMENQAGKDQGEEDQRERLRNAIGSGSETMADTNSEGHVQRGTGIQPTEGWIDAQHDAAACSSEGMDNSTGSRFETGSELQSGEGQGLHQSFSRSKTVSRPGEPQQAWEHPRVISRKVESSVGLSAHGYHFREDILRALGNSVYEDTAELAFRDLIRKHGIV